MAAVSGRLRFGALPSSTIPKRLRDDSVWVWCDFTDDVTGALVAVSGVTARAWLPGGALLSPAPTPVEESAGVWRVEIIAAFAGQWRVEMACTTPDEALAVRDFIVQERTPGPTPPAAVSAQPEDALLTNLAALAGGSVGLLEKTGPKTVAVRGLGWTVVSLLKFGVTGDGSTADGARIRTAIETAATDKLALVFPAAPTADGWLIADGASIVGKSDFALIGEPGAILGKPASPHYPLLTLNGCSRFAFDGLSFRGRSSGHVVLENCEDVLFRRQRNTVAGIQLFDGTRSVLFDDCWWTGTGSPTIQIGRSSQHPAGDPIRDVTIRACRFIGTTQEPIDMQNKPQRVLLDGCWFIDCNTAANEEALDIGGGECEDITVRDCFFDNTGTLSTYSVAWNMAINVKVEYGIRPKRVRIIRPTIRLKANAGADSFGIGCEADGYEIIGGEITGDVAYGLSLGGSGVGRVDGIRLIGQRTFGVRVRSNARARLRNIYSEVQAGGAHVVADSAAWADVHGEFVGGAHGVHFNTTATDCVGSGVFRNQTTYAFRASANAARAAFRGCTVSGAAKVAELRGDRQQIVGLTAEGVGAIGVDIVSGATNCRIAASDITGFTTAISDAGTGTVRDDIVTAGAYDALGPALFGASALPLVAPGEMVNAALTRAQSGSILATTLGSDGVTWSTAAADVARFYGTAQRLRREGARTNGVRNPRGEGAVAGSPGTMPTNWTLTVGSGLSREIVGSGTTNGLQWVDIRVSGTATGANGQLISVETANQISASLGQTWTSSGFVALVAGSTANLTGFRWIVNGTNGSSSTESTTISLLATISGTLQRFSATRTLNSASTTHVRGGLEYVYGSGAVDFTVRIAAPQIELGSFASTPILPPVSSPAASTRGADLITATLASLGVAASGASVMLADVMIPQAAPAAADQLIWQMDDGSDTNRIALVNPAGGSTVVVRRTTGGSTVSSTSLGAFTPGTPFRLGLAVDGAGRAVGRLGSGIVQAVTGCVTAGLTTVRVGNNQAGSSALFGEIGAALLSPDALGDETFGVLAAAGPRPLRAAQIVGL